MVRRPFVKLNLKARDWHNWVAVILLVPMLIVGLSTLFLSHKKSLGLELVDMTRYVGWLPGYHAGQPHARTPDVRSSLSGADGSLWIGTQHGLFRFDAGRAEAVDALAGVPVRGMAAAPWGMVVATKQGVWIGNGAGWGRSLEGDAWDASLLGDGRVAVALKERGLLASRDGRQWDAIPGLSAALAGIPIGAAQQERITLGKLMIDLHTGKAFFGKQHEWIWTDLLGATWVFLAFTGLWLWWRGQVRRRNAARDRRAAEAARG